jgi:hypothetical protein
VSRPYDPHHDDSYHPDDTPDLYLTAAQIEAALAALPATRDPAELAARELLHRLETSRWPGSSPGHVDEVQARIDAFRNRFGFWPWATDSMRLFYEGFGC